MTKYGGEGEGGSLPYSSPSLEVVKQCCSYRKRLLYGF